MENFNKRPKTPVFYAKHIPDPVGAGLRFKVDLWDPAPLPLTRIFHGFFSHEQAQKFNRGERRERREKLASN